MIHFKCPGCSAGLRVADEKAGKLTLCPSCGRKARAPARDPSEEEVVEELPVVEDEDEDDMATVEAAEDDDEEERPRPRRRRVDDDEYEEDDRPRTVRSKRAPPPEDEQPRFDIISRNRVMGVIGMILGLAFTAASLASGADVRNPLTTPYNMGGCLGLLLGLALLVVGAIYAIRG